MGVDTEPLDNMNLKVFACVLVVGAIAADAAAIRRKKRSVIAGTAIAAGLPLLGGYAIYRKLKTGSFAPPKASVGLSGGVGLGPLSLGGKVGIGGGGFPSAGEEAWYEPITADNPGVKGFVASGGVGVGNFNFGQGLALGLKKDYVAPQSGAVLGDGGEHYPAEIVNESEWVTVGESEVAGQQSEPQAAPQSSDLLGLQGGVAVGPLKLNAGFSAGR